MSIIVNLNKAVNEIGYCPLTCPVVVEMVNTESTSNSRVNCPSMGLITCTCSK